MKQTPPGSLRSPPSPFGGGIRKNLAHHRSRRSAFGFAERPSPGSLRSPPSPLGERESGIAIRTKSCQPRPRVTVILLACGVIERDGPVSRPGFRFPRRRPAGVRAQCGRNPRFVVRCSANVSCAAAAAGAVGGAVRAAAGRLGKPEEIAALAVYLASDESSYTTGQIHLADGGFAL